MRERERQLVPRETRVRSRAGEMGTSLCPLQSGGFHRSNGSATPHRAQPIDEAQMTTGFHGRASRRLKQALQVCLESRALLHFRGAPSKVGVTRNATARCCQMEPQRHISIASPKAQGHRNIDLGANTNVRPSTRADHPESWRTLRTCKTQTKRPTSEWTLLASAKVLVARARPEHPRPSRTTQRLRMARQKEDPTRPGDNQCRATTWLAPQGTLQRTPKEGYRETQAAATVPKVARAECSNGGEAFGIGDQDQGTGSAGNERRGKQQGKVT